MSTAHVFLILALAAITASAGDTEIQPTAEGVAMQDVHAQLSTSCFNECWNYLDKAERSVEDVESMVLLASASLWHWKQRTDCEPVNLSVGYWQVSRAYALAGHYPTSKFFGERCLHVSQDASLPPFYLGYAHEALAHAEALNGNVDSAQSHLTKAFEQLERIADKEERALLETDLLALKKGMASR
ncbi:MAG: hypothetical protein MUE60_13990 [Candidatus Eisenbacteria bacterium]|jgi:hypothetical protein|nr:hypothetical protein [Candidatus Eisenbacteria bacterium]